jgi:hypothetical protein
MAAITPSPPETRSDADEWYHHDAFGPQSQAIILKFREHELRVPLVGHMYGFERVISDRLGLDFSMSYPVFMDGDNADVDPNELEPGRTYTMRIVELSKDQTITPEASLSTFDVPTTQNAPGAPLRPRKRPAEAAA